ncbi:hypothetical protein RSOLAG22IIIB_03226 [Rhizoctonia solani]|uniref:Uncharacterized protein n=1 Tax=Rhizoctonia solani TaxID=456999 RepID=A0A0K6FNU5_9AGAM|nr:hypothetical protein RSOLAG22IIIB_03226 [Rhizoctonia solani]
MRRIVSALGLSKDKQPRHGGRRRAAATSNSRPKSLLRSESTPALVHHPDSASSSGIRTPSDVDSPDLLSVPAIVNPSSSSDSVAHSVRSAPSRWVGLLRTLSLKKHSEPQPVIDVDDGSSESSTSSERPRSPPALLPPPAPQFANGRRISSPASPASSIYRAGLAHVQRRGPPSRANLALQAFTQPLVHAAGAPTPHPLRAPDPASPQSYPRSVSHAHVPSQSLRIQLHRARVLQRLEEGALSPVEEASIAPFAARPPAPRSLRRTRPSPTEEWTAHLELGTRTGRWSRGLRRWVARPVFEDRIRVYTPTGTEIVQPARGLGTETLDFSDGTLAMAGLAIDTETDQTDDDYAPRRTSTSPAPITPPPRSGDPMATQFSSNTHNGASSAEPRTLGVASKSKPPIVRGVRFADDDDATDGDDLPLAVLASVQKKRAEREARARHARYVEKAQTTGDVNDRRRRSYAEEFARSREHQRNARAGIERPSSFVRDSDARRMALPTSGLTPVKEAAFTPSHSRSGSGGSGSSGQRRRSAIIEGVEQVVSPTRSGFSLTGSNSAPNTALSSPASPFSTLPRSLPSSTRVSPAPLPSPNPAFANRSISGSPLRSSFALGANPEEFGAMLSAAQTGSTRGAPTDMRTLMAQNQMLMAQNQMLANMMMGQNMMELGLPNPPFAHSGGSSASGSRGRSSARSSGGGSQGSVHRPGPSPVQPPPRRATVSVGPTSAAAAAAAAPRGRQMESRARGEASSRSRTRQEDSRAGHSKSASQSTAAARPGRHAHSKSEHSIPALRASKLQASVVAPPMPSVPHGIYSMRNRPRPAGEVVT